MTSDAPREAGHVADARARARLATGDLPLEHDRLEALRRCIDGRREAGGPGADDRDVVDVHAEARSAADRFDHVGVGRIDEARGRRAGRRRYAASRCCPTSRSSAAPSAESPCSRRERRVEAGQEVTDLMGALAVLGGRDPEHREPLRLGVAPSSRETRSRPDRGPARGTRASRGGSRSGRASSRARSGSPPCSPARRAGSASRTDGGRARSARNSMPVCLRHPLVGDQQSDRLVARSEVAQLLEPGGGPVRGDDPGVVPEALVEVALERGQDGGVGGDEEDDR